MYLPNVDFSWLDGDCDGVTEGLKVAGNADGYVVEGRRFFVPVLNVLVDVGRTEIDQECVNPSLASSRVITFMGGPVVSIESGRRGSIELVKYNVKDFASMYLGLQDC